ncbi:MAG: DUF2083 domain-containing protein [Pseudaminobacter sp.]|nr:DUF2083 domain-containing protein [Pseudaminobacter sp.]
MRVRSATPVEHVDAFIFEADNYFPELEAAAADFLNSRRPGETLEATAKRILPAEERQTTDPSMPVAAETRRFRLIKQLSVHIAGEAVRRIVETHPALGSEKARALATAALHAYAAGAILMPYDLFPQAAEQWRYDLDVFARLFGVSYEQTAHRLATLRRPGAEGVRFGFMRSDSSGYVTKRLPLPRLPLPRYGNACPLWPVYGAFQSPGVTVRGFGELPSGEQFFFLARAVEKRVPIARLPRHLLSVMLVCQARDAGRLVHADGIDRAGAMVPMGTICRLCPRGSNSWFRRPWATSR